ncbi:MAG TPA: hypothetical protein VK815_16840 [Candidatus Acidoferrales bacterium]|jgi:hypothetical protein|nr:hypothetical protein [Candidatus Acidoferrales bacterium]
MSKVTIVKEAAEKAMAAEGDRTRLLIGRAEKFVAGAAIVLGYQMTDLAQLLGSSSPWAKVSCHLALAALGLSLLFGFYSLRLKGYAGYPRGDTLWETLKPDDVTEDAAELAVIQLLLKTREQSAKLNDAKAGSLSWCGWLLFTGILLVLGSHLLDILANMW